MRKLSARAGGMLAWLSMILMALWLGCAHASPEEIIIFADEGEKAGEFGYELHLNYASRARRVPDYPGETPPEGVFRVMPELSYGLSDSWNWGLHVPMSYKAGKTTIDGFKARLTNVNRHETEWGSWFYGANYEISYFRTQLSDDCLEAEVLGILGMRRGDWLFVVNPSLGRTLKSNTSELDKRLDLDINYKVMKSLSPDLAVGFEHYSEIGKFERPEFGGAAGQITYAMVEFKTKSQFEFSIGIGHGWTDPIDKRVYKMVVGFPF